MSSTTFSLDTALVNLSYAFTNIKLLIVALSYVLGVGMVVRGLMMYRIFAVQTLSSAQKGEMAGPMVFIIVGSILIYLPSTYETTLTTVFGGPEVSEASQLISYSSLSGSEKWRDLSEVIVQYIYLVGLIAFIRGWVILSKMGHSGAQPGSIGKGIIHLIGGVLLINIVDTVNLLAETFGYTGG